MSVIHAVKKAVSNKNEMKRIFGKIGSRLPGKSDDDAIGNVKEASSFVVVGTHER